MLNNPKMMKELQQMQKRMAQMQEELADVEITGTAGGGVVTVVVDGQQNPRAVRIEPEALEEGAELLGDLVLAALTDALTKSREQQQKQMGSLLPPGML